MKQEEVGCLGVTDANPSYQEILKLDQMLADAEIPHLTRRYFDGWQITYPSTEEWKTDVFEHRYSFGRERDNLEITGLLTEEETEEDFFVVLSSAEEVFNRIYEDFTKKKGKY